MNLGAEGIDVDAMEEEIHGWAVHPSIAVRTGNAVLKVGRIEEPWQVAQFGMEYDLRLMYWVAEPFYIGHGLGLGYSYDTDMSKGLGRPGMANFFADLAFGAVERPDPDTTLLPGIEFRASAHYGWIHYTNLSLFWLRTTLRPHIRFLGQHLELSLPLSVSWRRDPMASFEYGLELGVVL